MWKVVYATDFSEHSVKAMNVILRYKNLIEEVILVRVINIHKFAIFGRDNLIEEEKRVSLEKLKEIEALFYSNGLKCRSFLRVGDPAEEIVKLAEKVGADIIVMGHRGRSFLKKILLGSVAEGVVKISNNPVLVVRGGINIFSKILYVHYPLDLTFPEILKNIPYDKLYVLHVVEPMLPPESTTHVMEEKLKKAEEILEKIADELGGEPLVKVGGVSDTIIKTAKELGVGCVVLRIKRFSRVTDSILRFSKNSVLIVKYKN